MKVKIAAVVILLAAVATSWIYWKKNEALVHGKIAFIHTEAILDCGPRPPASEGLAKAQSYISTELSKHGWSTMVQSFERDTPVGKRVFTNLIARYQPGELASLEDLKKLPTKGILSAHLDSKLIPGIPDFLGADDAASACGLIIELAANLAQDNPELAKQLEIVFFDGEESFGKNMTPPLPADPVDGLYGSKAYSFTLYDRKPKPSFGIVLDMVGHKNLKIAVPADTPPQLYVSMIKAAEKHGHAKHYSQLRGLILDDHHFMNKAGVPTIDIIGAGFSESHWWHQEGDDIDLISPKSLSISYDVTMTMLVELLAK